jgi:hypothetical protein
MDHFGVLSPSFVQALKSISSARLPAGVELTKSLAAAWLPERTQAIRETGEAAAVW